MKKRKSAEHRRVWGYLFDTCADAQYNAATMDKQGNAHIHCVVDGRQYAKLRKRLVEQSQSFKVWLTAQIENELGTARSNASEDKPKV